MQCIHVQDKVKELYWCGELTLNSGRTVGQASLLIRLHTHTIQGVGVCCIY